MAEVGLGLREAAQRVIGGAPVEAGRLEVGPAGEHPVEDLDRLRRSARSGQHGCQIGQGLGEVAPRQRGVTVGGLGLRELSARFQAEARAEEGVGMIRVDRQGLPKGRLGALDIAGLEAGQAAIEVGPWVVGSRRQNFSSPRWRTGSGKSR